MPCGKHLVNQVAAVLTDQPATSFVIRDRLVGTYSSRAVRYAIAELVKEGRAKLRGKFKGYVASATPDSEQNA